MKKNKPPRIDVLSVDTDCTGPMLALASVRIQALGLTVRGLRLLNDHTLQGPQVTKVVDGERVYSTYVCFDKPLHKRIREAVLSAYQTREGGQPE